MIVALGVAGLLLGSAVALIVSSPSDPYPYVKEGPA